MTISGMTICGITLSSPVHAELLYHVLAHLDLERDAASLHHPELPETPWRGRLLAAYRRAPGRLVVQGLALYADSVEGLVAMLEPGAVGQLGDPAGVALARALAEALGHERPAVERRMLAREAAPSKPAARTERFTWIAAHLGPLRRALWADGPTPSLSILDCPSLLDRRDARRTHGRAAGRGDRRVVAASLDGCRELALCQLLHEECHAVSDAVVAARLAPGALAGRDTKAGSAGHALHQQLELEAIELGQRVIAEHRPALAEAYRRWRAPFA